MIAPEIIRHALLSLGTEDDFGLYEALGNTDRINPTGKGRENLTSTQAALTWLIDKRWITIRESNDSKTTRVLPDSEALAVLKRPESFALPAGGGPGLVFGASTQGERAYRDGTCCPSNPKRRRKPK